MAKKKPPKKRTAAQTKLTGMDDRPTKLGQKFSRLQREKILAQVEEMECRGFTHGEIAEKVGVSRVQVTLYVKKLKGRYRHYAHEDRKEAVYEQIHRLRYVRKHAWEAYFESMKERLFETEEFGYPKFATSEDGEEVEDFDASMKLIKRIVKKEQRLPASQFLDIVLRTLDLEATITGLKQDAVNIFNINPSSDERPSIDFAAMGVVRPVDPVDGKVIDVKARVLALPEPKANK